jgi:Transposase IS116/IS110/IS902 family
MTVRALLSTAQRIQLLVSWWHAGRMRSEAAFAALAGVNPIPASCGQIIRHRLNRSGDRQRNRALHTIVLARLREDPATRAYAVRRRAEGRERPRDPSVLEAGGRSAAVQAGMLGAVRGGARQASLMDGWPGGRLRLAGVRRGRADSGRCWPAAPHRWRSGRAPALLRPRPGPRARRRPRWRRRRGRPPTAPARR